MQSPDLNMFFSPTGVAVIGASRVSGKLGNDVIVNLLDNGYEGPIYPVNPSAGEILGLPCYASIDAIPDPVDLAIIVLPAPYVLRALEDCGKRRIRGVTIISGGFREVGTEGIGLEEELKRIAAEYDIAVLGPNCIGTIDTHQSFNSTFVTGIPLPGEIALVSQSGALAAAIINWAQRAGIGLSRLVSSGNQAVISESDMIRATAEDEYTKVISLYIEGVEDGQAFIDAASETSQKLPVIGLKVGRGEGGAKAVASHTGALAGADIAYDAAMRRAGVLRADNLEQMLDWARALATQPLPKGNRVAVVTNAGGLGVIAVDALEAAGMRLAPLTEETRSHLRSRVFPAASVKNPVDILAGSGPASYTLCVDAVLADETVDAVVVAIAPQRWFDPLSLAEIIAELGSSFLSRKKPLLAVMMGLTPGDPSSETLQAHGIPNYPFPARVGSTLGAMWQRRQWLDQCEALTAAVELDDLDTDTAAAAVQAGLEVTREQMESADADSALWMPVNQVESLMQSYGISVPASGLAPDVDQALLLAETIGYPLVLKLEAAGLSHKTDVGGVRLGIESPDDLRIAFTEMVDQFHEKMPHTSIDGVRLQPMVDGMTELIVGMVRDPQFGPLIMVGAGGTQVELQKDVAFDLAPINHYQAEALIDQTSAGQLLAGFRGGDPADRDAVVDVVVRLSQLALDWPQIAEVEINPLIVRRVGEGASAVDARLRLDPDAG
ncbi:MAG: acetate--CoA ligase family protein [Anaerolineae bacterium]|nr:acetate--CoA ligase family protein [Anaerolineae bacterium]